MGVSLSKLIQEQCYVTDDCIKSSVLLHPHSFTIHSRAFKMFFFSFFQKSNICVQMREDTYRIGMHNNASSRDKTLI